ncbi:glycosyltransferase [Aciduricibacillus chroicocephali]|uniref:Glycosyltransferase n=1 Tax=Aciduricibacillus chroicocephali TaxID=3054939 RepID=A0ABY9KYR2_9BACI|nr:glycosyltransferase [Bacillaceae bacterium 44XB]
MDIKEQSVFFLTNSLDVNRGGLSKAVLAQTKTFVENGYNTHLLTFNFNTRYNIIREELIALGQLDSNVKLYNMYDLLCGIEEDSITPLNLKETGYLDKRDGYNAYRVYENGMYVRYRSYHQDDSLDFIDHFDEHRYRTKREIYDNYGHIRKVSFMDFALNKPRQMIFYNNKGTAYLSKWVNPETGKAIRVNWFDDDGKIKATYKNDDELKVKWIERMISSSDNPVIISDSRMTDALMLKISNKDAVKIWRLHSNHLTVPFENDSDIAPTVQLGMDNLAKIDAAVVLTNHQKREIEERFGKLDNLYAIPHAFESNLKKNFFGKLNVKKDENKAVVVSRLSKIKNIHHMIKAFEIVVKSLPEAKLDIWGNGNEKESIQTLINELELENNVFLKGYTNDPSGKYQSALFGLLTSKTEGFALSILESMANATPVISYDIRYGAREMIENGKNGVLIEKNDIDQLAKEMIKMFCNPDKAINMGEAAYDTIKNQFNNKVYADNWNKVVFGAIANRKKKNSKN